VLKERVLFNAKSVVDKGPADVQQESDKEAENNECRERCNYR